MVRFEGPAFVTTLTLMTLLAACPEGPDGAVVRAEGPLRQESRTFEAFERIALRVPGELDVEVGGQDHSLTVEAPASVLPLLRTEIHDGVLEIDFARPVTGLGTLNLTLRTPKVVAVSVHGAAEVEVEGLSGGPFDLEIGGAADVELEGRVDGLRVNAQGAGHVEAVELEARTATVVLSGAGHVDVFATESLNATIQGVGAIRYKGDPRVRRQVQGVGSIERLDAPEPAEAD